MLGTTACIVDQHSSHKPLQQTTGGDVNATVNRPNKTQKVDPDLWWAQKLLLAYIYMHPCNDGPWKAPKAAIS